MKIELKSLKIARHLSEETTAFTAKISVDGKVVGDVRNDGNGGCHMVHLDPSARDAVEAEAARLHPPKAKYDDPMEDLVNALLEKEEDRKQALSFLKKGYPFVVKVFAKKRVLPSHDGGEPHEYYQDIFVIGYRDPSQLDGILKENKAEKHEVLA